MAFDILLAWWVIFRDYDDMPFLPPCCRGWWLHILPCHSIAAGPIAGSPQNDNWCFSLISMRLQRDSQHLRISFHAFTSTSSSSTSTCNIFFCELAISGLDSIIFLLHDDSLKCPLPPRAYFRSDSSFPLPAAFQAGAYFMIRVMSVLPNFA